MSWYTVVGLVQRATGVLEIAAVLPGHVDTCDLQENAETVRWSCYVTADDVYEAETFAHYRHRFGGVPTEHRAIELTLGSVVVDENNDGHRVHLLSLDGDIVRVWFDESDHEPAQFDTNAPVRAVLTPTT
ncbi:MULTISPECIES: hypothetical protein [Actinosynnema]|uniref:hypothetical protein n=1 Tax=Actinosynnema TaxID=40566 RepID=UPI0020A26746|nr:hypothetical protein [Actinosynnema pretiosum]MCP2097479.1 hypothetical protein [Actinosynnema pretiosum]